MAIQVTCALIFHDGRLLFAQRSESMSHPLYWEFPGGKVLPGESAEHCIRREIKEELNIEIDVLSKLPPVEQSYGDKQIELIPYICAMHPGAIILSEHKQYEWLKRDEVQDYQILEADMRIISNLGDDEVPGYFK